MSGLRRLISGGLRGRSCARKFRGELASVLALGCLLAPGGSALASGGDDAILPTLAEWTRVAVRDLRLRGTPKPHRAVAATTDLQVYSARALFGALVAESSRRARPGRMEVVVGDDELDSSRFESRWHDATPRQTASFAVEDAKLAMARDLWVMSDVSYKRALQIWQAKVASRAAAAGQPRPPDWSAAPTVSLVDEAAPEPVDQNKLKAIALEASAGLWDLGGLDNGEVLVNGVSFRYYLATSEGTRLSQPEGYAAIFARAVKVTDGGLVVGDARQWVVDGTRYLPSKKEIIRQVRRMGESVLDRVAAAQAGEPVQHYEGPVLFEGEAAAQLFSYLVPPEVSGTPPPPRPGRSYQQLTRHGPRLGRRLLPAGWTVVDDPSSAPQGLAGGYAYDREGVKGERVEVVQNGYVRDLLMSRIPRADKEASNGHARGSVTGNWVGRPAVWEVVPAQPLSDSAFEKAVATARAEAGLDRILVARRLSIGREGTLPSPTQAFWRGADGKEEPVALLEFQRVDRRTLKDIIAASDGKRVHAYLAGWTPRSVVGTDRGLATVVTTPSKVLVEDMELAFPGSSREPLALPPPPRKDRRR